MRISSWKRVERRRLSVFSNSVSSSLQQNELSMPFAVWFFHQSSWKGFLRAGETWRLNDCNNFQTRLNRRLSVSWSRLKVACFVLWERLQMTVQDKLNRQSKSCRQVQETVRGRRSNRDARLHTAKVVKDSAVIGNGAWQWYADARRESRFSWRRKTRHRQSRGRLAGEKRDRR